MPQVDELRRARAFLLRAVEPPAPHTYRLVSEVGPVEAAHRLHNGVLAFDFEAERRPVTTWHQADDDLAVAAENGFRLVIPEDDEWPDAGTAGGVGPPLALWVRGDTPLHELAKRSVTIVGARASSAYGETVTGDLAYQLARDGIATWSGAAYGIDGAAHRGALAAEAPTVAVLACGLDIDYPSGHRQLLEDIAATGAVVSEYPFRLQPKRQRFVARNRILALFTRGVVVAEAGRRSGAKTVARFARQLGRPVCAIPGPVTSATSSGCHELIQQGAELVTNAADVQTVLTLGAR